MSSWISELAGICAAGAPAVLVTIAGVRGSAPRETGAKMIVTAVETIGTIGGGQLEYECTRLSCELLAGGDAPVHRRFPLGASMGQCCGGVVDVLFEPSCGSVPSWLRELDALYARRETAVLCTDLGDGAGKCIVTADAVYPGAFREIPVEIAREARIALEDGRGVRRMGQWLLDPVAGTDFNVAVFGAGHVGAALVRVLSMLDCNLRWIDGRRDMFGGTPPNVCAIESADPAAEVAAMPPGSCYVVMTHSHALDFDICARILSRRDVVYCGLIGSESKRRRFEKRFRGLGLSDDMLMGLTCPIGVRGISGKQPAEIAVAAAAEVLQARERARGHSRLAYPDNVHSLRGER